MSVARPIERADILELTVASYNIHGCQGLDGRVDLDRIAQVIGEFDTDTIALQELSIRRGPGGNLEQLNYLAKATGLEGIPGPVLLHMDSPCGTGLLTRRQVLGVRHLDLSIPGREPRGALDVDLHVAGMVVRIISTHLGLRAWERRTQVNKLIRRQAVTQSHLVVLTGDMNEWWPWRRSLRALHEYFGQGPPAPCTFPSFLPLLALDRLWVRQQPAVLEILIKAYRTPLTRLASDHLPLLTRITVDRTKLQRV